MAAVWLYEIKAKGRRAKLESASVNVSPGDNDACRDLLRTMARRHGKSPADCELVIKSGRTTKSHRII